MPDRQRLAEYLSIIGEPPSDRAAAARLACGQFHDVVLVGDVAYRFPRDEESRARLPARAALLTVLAHRRLPVAVPGLVSQAALHEPLGRCHVVLRRVPGQPFGREAVTGAREQAAVARDLAALLDRLARLGGDAGIRAVVPTVDRQLWHRFAADVSTVLFPLMQEHGRKRAEAELSRVQSVDPVGGALVHGDLGGTNLLWHTVSSRSGPPQSGPPQSGPPEPGPLEPGRVEPGRVEPGDAAGRHGAPAAGPGPASATLPRLAGVLDWDEARIGSQADDLASIAATFGWPLARRVDARRHAGQTPTIAAAEAIAATFALQQALPAALSGDAASLADGLTRYRDRPV